MRSLRSHAASIVAAGLLAALAGCTGTDLAADLGSPPPIDLQTVRQTLYVQLLGDPHLAAGERERLGQQVAALAAGELGAVRAHIYAANAGDSDAVGHALTGFGVDPGRIIAEASSSATPLLPAVLLTRSFVRTTGCAAAIAPAWADNPLPSLASISRCVQSNNLATMLADPADLVSPVALGPADGPSAIDTVAAWRSHRDASLPAAATSTSPTSSAGGSTSGPVASGNVATPTLPVGPTASGATPPS